MWVALQQIANRALSQRLRTWFPDREFFMRSQGQVRFIKLSSRVQIRAAAALSALVVAWLVTMAVITIGSLLATHDRMALLQREAQVSSAENRVSAYRKDVGAAAADLGRRQDFIEKMVNAHLGALPSDAQSGEQAGEAGRAVEKVGLAMPEAAPLARLEARQLAFVEQLTQYADHRAALAEAAIRKLGLNPMAMRGVSEDRSAMGGPFVALATNADGSLDPRFKRLGASLARMDALVSGLQGIPNVLPASLDYISSGFGYRADPFTGVGAFHAGLDFKGPIGAPIYAAARGRVSFVGQRSGYGNCVEVDHGNGLVTRYAHMSAFHTVAGKEVVAGEQIGAIGSSGRSTGPHLHFEVRIHDQPVNPRPFLEAAPHVLKEIRDRPDDSSHAASRK
ncbi:MAG: M23 family metallopeptidase [Novosphingobium sp.]